MRCCKALRGATTPQQAVNRSWADVQLIDRVLHCENRLRSGEQSISTVDSTCGALDFQVEHPEGDQGVALPWLGTVMAESHAVEDIEYPGAGP